MKYWQAQITHHYNRQNLRSNHDERDDEKTSEILFVPPLGAMQPTTKHGISSLHEISTQHARYLYPRGMKLSKNNLRHKWPMEKGVYEGCPLFPPYFLSVHPLQHLFFVTLQSSFFPCLRNFSLCWPVVCFKTSWHRCRQLWSTAISSL